jgi:copper oxidase (laccase) domain-containing protein
MVERFPALDALPGIRSAFVTRIPGIDVVADRETALARLQPAHDALIRDLGLNPPAFAEQVHGNLVTTVSNADTLAPAADGLATNVPDLTLGIYVADCAAIFLVDPRRRAIALLHSGRKGTELNILAAGVNALRENFGVDPADLVGVVSPCIRPPHYDVDFAATISAQARALGVGAFHDAEVCTAANPDRYYSYRRESGRTGRMLALLSLKS